MNMQQNDDSVEEPSGFYENKLDAIIAARKIRASFLEKDMFVKVQESRYGNGYYLKRVPIDLALEGMKYRFLY